MLRGEPTPQGAPGNYENQDNFISPMNYSDVVITTLPLGKPLIQIWRGCYYAPVELVDERAYPFI